MLYSVNTSGKPVMLNVLANTDTSIVGLEIGNSRIISMSEKELCEIDSKAHRGMMEYHRIRTLFKYHVLKEPLIVMETIGKNEISGGHRVPDMLKLYKSADIFSCYTTYYKFEQNNLTHGGFGEVLLREHPICWPVKPYTMTEEERTQFETWWKSHKNIFDACNNSDFEQIVKLYLDSFMMEDAETAFVVLCVVLEKLFGTPDNNELTYRISRGTALFLSSDRSEMRNIYSQVKKLYKFRSKYVHAGTQIEWKNLFELREIVRKIIVNMSEHEMNKSCFNFKKFAQELAFDGYVKEAVSIAMSSD